MILMLKADPSTLHGPTNQTMSETSRLNTTASWTHTILSPCRGLGGSFTEQMSHPLIRHSLYVFSFSHVSHNCRGSRRATFSYPGHARWEYLDYSLLGTHFSSQSPFEVKLPCWWQYLYPEYVVIMSFRVKAGVMGRIIILTVCGFQSCRVCFLTMHPKPGQTGDDVSIINIINM